MANYNDAQALLQQLKPIINECIENHPNVKAAIKAKKAVVWEQANTTNKTVKVKFLPDIFNEEVAPLTLPYNPQMESYLTTGTVKGKTVSVWYYQSVTNGIVMQDGLWSIREMSASRIVDLIYPVGSIYISANTTSPASLFGGGWQQIEGRFLLGANSTHPLGSMAGTELHTHSVGTPSSNDTSLHALIQFNYDANGNSVLNTDEGDYRRGWLPKRQVTGLSGQKPYDSQQFRSAAVKVVGDTLSASNIPPYLAVNIWQRIS